VELRSIFTRTRGACHVAFGSLLVHCWRADSGSKSAQVFLEVRRKAGLHAATVIAADA